MHRLLPVLVAALVAGDSLTAGELRFRRHEVNLESTFPAAAAIDVNEDGRLDIVCGGFWYAAPTWERHFLREVQEIRGRYDDYSNLELDVNGNGRIDLISANYRSETIFWIENPGPAASPGATPPGSAAQIPWPTHTVASPGPMETGRLYDIDGDGRLDLLPAGVKFAAWWSIDPKPESSTPGPQRTRGAEPVWNRHPLPDELIGHGIGFGDINGDGRGDIVGVGGWAECPADARNDRWIWHDDFRLHRDASIPILVYDVDGDGDADIVWGRGHQTGLYWLEQDAGTWRQHTIDTEFSQFHSLLLADLDQDGRPEIIAGKRYLGHEGKDVGEYDPMVVAAYTFDPQRRVFERTILDRGSRAGFDLDPKVVDLDGDGDLDLICPTRGGLCWLENLLVSEPDAVPTTPEVPAAISDHTDLSVYADAEGGKPIETPDDWGRRRAQILANMQFVMGPLPGPEQRFPLQVTWGEEQTEADHRRQKLTIDIGRGEQIHAWLLRPNEVQGRGPAMLCLHQTVPIGKDEPAGLGGKQTLHYARELAGRGCVCLVPDYPSFGEDDFDFVAHADRWKSGTMKAIWNNLRCLDLLETLPDVNPDRIGVIGHSLGGHNALFTAAFDQRIGAVVTSCGFTGFHHYYGGNLAGWTSPRYMPRIKDLYESNPDRVPFDFYEVLGAIAPRPIFINAPIHDSNFDIAGVRKVVEAVAPVYELTRSRDQHRVTLVTPESQHDFPDAVREQAYEWLDKVLK
jgi:dienelactone hydrolase